MMDTTMPPNVDYVRTEEELLAQKNYEKREASRHLSAVQIHYRIIEGKPPGNVIVRKMGWRVGRKVGEEKESLSPWIFRRIEANDYVAKHTKMDSVAAERLGLHVHLTVQR